MKLALFTLLLLNSSLTVFNFSYKYNHFKSVLMSLPKASLVVATYVDDTTKEVLFNQRKLERIIDDYFSLNIRDIYTYAYTLHFDYEGEGSIEDRYNKVHLIFDAPLLLHYRYVDELTITIVKQYA